MPMDHEQSKADQQRASTHTSQFREYEPIENSQNLVRALPPWPGATVLAFLAYKHFHTFIEPKVTPCYELMWPGRNITCPQCYVIAQLSLKGIDAGRCRAQCKPQMNVVDRYAQDPWANPCVWESTPPIYTSLTSAAYAGQCDLTSLDMGYDIMITPKPTKRKGRDGKQYTNWEAAIRPGSPTPLVPQGWPPEIGQKWINGCHNLSMSRDHRLPDWNTDDGRREWSRMQQTAQALERYYLASQQVQVPGFTPPAQGYPAQQYQQPQQPYPQQQPPQAPLPGFNMPAQPQYPQQQVTAPAPPPQQSAPPPPPQAPQSTPFPGAPQLPQQPQQSYPAAPAAPQFAPPPQMAQQPQQQSYTPPPAPSAPMVGGGGPSWQNPAAPPQNFPAPPVPTTHPPVPGAPPQQQPQMQPPPPQQQMPQQPQQPYQPQLPYPPPQQPQPMMQQVPQQGMPPQYPQPPTAPPPGAMPQQNRPSLTQTSADQVPPCYGHSRKDLSVSWRGSVGGFDDGQDQQRSMRCATCPYEPNCKEYVFKTFAGDYVS